MVASRSDIMSLRWWILGKKDAFKNFLLPNYINSAPWNPVGKFYLLYESGFF